MLDDTPGVFVQERYGQELRLSVRGSGIARGFHLRGVEVLQDGIPVNLADGSGDFYQIDPLALRSVAVFPGGNALAFGASTLGGAINFVTPTAQTAEAPNILRAEAASGAAGGSPARCRGSSAMRMRWPTTRISRSDGWRQHSRSSYDQFNANVGYRISDNVETRFYAGVYGTRQLLPGTLTLGQALNTPRMANPAALSLNQARNITDRALRQPHHRAAGCRPGRYRQLGHPQVAVPPDLPGDRPGRADLGHRAALDRMASPSAGCATTWWSAAATSPAATTPCNT